MNNPIHATATEIAAAIRAKSFRPWKRGWSDPARQGKTNVSTLLADVQCRNDVFGRTSNPCEQALPALDFDEQIAV